MQSFLQFGLLDLPWWGYVIVTLIMTHMTIASVTIFLHRHQAHHALQLHPVVSHCFRFWLWLTTGMVTKEWVAIHRKHHAKCETIDDPHSPRVHGIGKVLFKGAKLYCNEADNLATLEKYGHGTPDDWSERNLYSKHVVLGIGIMLVIDFVLFGPIGFIVWGVQMLWIPFFAAGVINGVGHYYGYRNFAPNDTSTNIVPWGILIGGEELHNNHHAYVSSAKLSNKWWEFDIGWVYIRILELLGLATVRKVAPKVHFNQAKTPCDEATLQAVITHRYDVLAKFAKYLKKTIVTEIRSLRARTTLGLQDAQVPETVKYCLQNDVGDMGEKERVALNQALHSSQVLRTIYSMRQDLTALWSSSTISKKELIDQLENWCQRAEGSGINALQEFSRKLRCYD
ncbi:stearoyl-CoA desaturase (delta-9 desaturase) [Nitrosomonas cryotolerans]|uniref:Stearoyl-CoA desaturase (Delta-9 desaturase) n=1 Tax=Nitrosomonas cryotolerans ATCC 49181 TaxID=1131553 RepID=A0A1N6GCI8_9PROT|nr:fatty acid desaturase [Nitrosomonas cryotolerans]SFQ04462.1 stearoyl-CoA desaturase (delta-9 desaturase) [Nitrosomonas cryotolerans]SIO05174.1 stearoyl-CoA desaturase (delta-9 desaturase) [Nitrosomonas cryotolerans ATCC 49181]